jgi:hypothetical protein
LRFTPHAHRVAPFCSSQVIIKDTLMPWIVPIRFTFLAAIAPMLLFK